MKDYSITQIFLIVTLIALGFLVGRLWRAEQVIRLRIDIDKQSVIFSQTQTYLNQFDFNEIARDNWRQLGYGINAKNDSVALK